MGAVPRRAARSGVHQWKDALRAIFCAAAVTQYAKGRTGSRKESKDENLGVQCVRGSYCWKVASQTHRLEIAEQPPAARLRTPRPWPRTRARVLQSSMTVRPTS